MKSLNIKSKLKVDVVCTNMLKAALGGEVKSCNEKLISFQHSEFQLVEIGWFYVIVDIIAILPAINTLVSNFFYIIFLKDHLLFPYT